VKCICEHSRQSAVDTRQRLIKVLLGRAFLYLICFCAVIKTFFGDQRTFPRRLYRLEAETFSCRPRYRVHDMLRRGICRNLRVGYLHCLGSNRITNQTRVRVCTHVDPQQVSGADLVSFDYFFACTSFINWLQCQSSLLI
jgi:hypothetical protein